MKTKNIILRVLTPAFLVLALGFFISNDTYQNSHSIESIEQIAFDANNIKSYIWSSGIFNQNLAIQNTPGFEWPKGSGHDAVYTSGLTLAAYVNNQLRMAVVGECREYM